MEILVIDSDPAARAVLLGRLQELKRSNELQRIEPIPLLPKKIGERSFAPVGAVILGPGLASTAASVMEALAPKAYCPIAALFYPAPRGAVSLSADNDEVLKVFLIQSLAKSQLARLAEARKVIGIAQFIGGVGATTLTIELGKALAADAIKTTLVDLDDVSPTLSMWGKVAPRFRSAVSDALLSGTVSDTSVNEMLAAISPNLTIIAQPESYAEAFHFKANVLESAPVSSVMMNSLLSSLRARDHTVVIDLARSWGLASFASLPRCGQIFLVVGGESNERVKQSIECLRRFKRESDAADEFDTLRWSIVVTRCEAARINEVRQIVIGAQLFPESVQILFLSAPACPTFAAEIERIAGLVR